MPLLEKHLFVKRSMIPGAGKGLFTKLDISKGTRIIEYKGKVTTWKKILENEIFNGYVYYFNRNHVVDAKPYIKALARYANDANGLTKVKGLRNNSKYVKDNGKVFIEASKNISAGEEILVSYGRDYWGVVIENHKLAVKEKRKKTKNKVSRSKKM